MFAPIAPWIVRCAYRVPVDALQRGLDLRLWVTGRGRGDVRGEALISGEMASKRVAIPLGRAGRAGVEPRALRVGARRGDRYVLTISFVP